MQREGLQHHFHDIAQQERASSLGMWVFLAQEMLFFGGLFAGYTVYRLLHAEAFAEASRSLDVVLGGINTAVLIGSSLTVVFAVSASRAGATVELRRWLLGTIALGAVFLAIKAVEYAHKIHEGHVPGPGFRGAPAEQLFFSFYFAMTGMHALHMIVGIGILAVLVGRARQLGPERRAVVENFGLYWHFVDIVWIFLFPLLYLVGRHA
jgi:cytochrome c oxidase subunit III